MDSGRGAQAPASLVPFADPEQVGPLSPHQQLEQPTAQLIPVPLLPWQQVQAGRRHSGKETPWHVATGSSLVTQVAPRR